MCGYTYLRLENINDSFTAGIVSLIHLFAFANEGCDIICRDSWSAAACMAHARHCLALVILLYGQQEFTMRCAIERCNSLDVGLSTKKFTKGMRTSSCYNFLVQVFVRIPPVQFLIDKHSKAHDTISLVSSNMNLKTNRLLLAHILLEKTGHLHLYSSMAFTAFFTIWI